ncbi:unnamed protein product, partial [Leptidea sinapis]
MFSKNLTTKDSFLEQMKAAREERALEKKREESAIKIQSIVRGWLARQRFISLILEEFDNLLPDTNHGSQDEGQSEFVQALDVYKVACRLFLVFKQKRDSKRFERLCKYIVHSLHSESVKISYVGVFLNKDYSLRWIAHIKDLLFKCCQYLEQLKPEYPADMQSILIHLHTLLEFTATNTWAITRLKNFDKLRGGLTQLCANNISLSAVIALALRPLISAQFSEKLLTMFIIQILSVPTLVYQMNQISPESISTFRTHALFDKCVEFLSADQNMRIVFNTLEGNYALCLLGNLVQLAYIDRDYAQTDTFYPTFVLVVTRFLDSCQQYVVCKKGNLSNWHPVLGWFSQSFDAYLPPTMTNLRVQLSLLWGVPLLKRMLGDPLKEMLDAGVCDDAGPSQPSTPVQINNPAAFIWRAIESRTNRANSSKSYRKLGSAESTKIALICAMYHTALQTMTQVKLDILTGLCNQDEILYSLWRFLCTLGPSSGLKSFLDLLAVNTKSSAPEFQMLILFADCMTHYVTILDDMEMYEKQEPFKLSDFVNMSAFLNMFIYKSIIGQLFVFRSVHTLLLVLYRRDCRRAYTPAGHWLVLVQKTPHMIAHGERVRLFRRAVADEKVVLGLTERACVGRSTLVTVRRTRLVEDGYRQLAALPSRALRAVVRVRFINEQGLDEAGIDQDGVFK